MFGGQFLLWRLVRHPSGLVGLTLIMLAVAMAVFADWFYASGPWTLAGPPRLWPGQDPSFPLGTDSLGRDLAAGLFHGARVSLAVGIAAAAVSVVIGTVVGGLSGYYGGWLDDVLMRLTDAMQTIPSFLSAIAIVGILGPSLSTIIFAIAIVSWPMIATTGADATRAMLPSNKAGIRRFFASGVVRKAMRTGQEFIEVGPHFIRS